MIQRRNDPQSDYTEYREVYGYFDNNNIYRFEANSVDNKIKAVEQIALPVGGVGIFIATNRMIDVGKYHIAVYSAANCVSTPGTSKITNSSAWFYTFSTKLWNCMDLGNTPATYETAWTVPV